MPDLGQMIEAEIARMQKLPPRAVPQQLPEVPLGSVIERMVEAGLPQTIRDFEARQKARATFAKQNRIAEQQADYVTYEKYDPGF